MSPIMAATEAGLAQRIRTRIADGAPVRETGVDEIPAWFAAEIGESGVKAMFQSEHAAVAVLENGRTVVRRTRA